MESAPPPSLEATLLQRWFPVSLDGKSTREQDESFSETDLRDISDVLRRVGQGTWSRIPRVYAVLRLLGRLDVIDLFLAQAISDVYFPFTHHTLPQALSPSVAHGFLQLQRVVLSSALDLERETGRHRHFSSTNDVPFIKVEDLGKGAYGYVDRVISTISHKEYARKLIPRGRTFQRDQRVLRDFERELGTLKKLRHHRHIVQLVGSYTDPRFVGIVMSPVAECDLKDFLNNCTSDAPSKHSRKSLARSFFGCLTSALSYLHDNTIRHKDIKPQNVLVSQHTVYLTDFGISLDWSEIGQSTTTGPTPKTARYCAPEVSDYAPRNTSSDMWSLGCIFLEIWTVLKGESIANLYSFLEANGALSSCYHLNSDATFDWMKLLESKPTLADNPPQEWIRHLLVEDKGKRWTARQLLSEIETVNNNPDVKFAFSGQCCMEELESAESVLSSNGSIYETAAGDIVPQPPPSVASLTPAPDEEELPKLPSVGLTTRRNIPPSNSNDNTSNSLTVAPELDSTTLTDKRTISPATSELALRSIPQDEEDVPVVDGESSERNLHSARPENSALDSDPTFLEPRVDDLGRIQSTHPEISLAPVPTSEPSYESATHLIPTQDALTPSTASEGMAITAPQIGGLFAGDMPKLRKARHMNTEDSAAETALSEANKPSIQTEQARDNGLDVRSTIDLNHYARQGSDFTSPNFPPAIAKDLLEAKRRTAQAQYSSPLLDFPQQVSATQTRHTTQEDLPAFTTVPNDVQVNEPESRGQDHADHARDIPRVYTEDHSKTVDSQPHLPALEKIVSPSPSPRLNAPFSGPEPTPDAPTDVVPYTPFPAPKTKETFPCKRCYEPLSGQYVKIPPSNDRFHLDCFTCADCSQIVADKFFPVPGKIIGGKFLSIANPPKGHTQQIPLCEIDYFRRLDLLCHTCGGAVRGSYITAMDNKYHIEHFTCTTPGCGKVFGATDSYYEHEGGVYCKPHYGQRAQLCHGCGTAIFKDFAEIYRNGENQFWHPECYMIHKFWKVALKNEFAEFFRKRESPQQNGLEVPQDLVGASVDRTEKFTTRVWLVFSHFEENCATSLSDILLHIRQSDIANALSTSAYFLIKIERYFMALGELDNIEQAQKHTELPIARDQKLLCRKLIEIFVFMESMDTRRGVSQVILEITTGVAHYLKVLIRRGLQSAMSLDPHIERGVMTAFIANVENVTRTDMQSDLQHKFRHAEYHSRNAEVCTICQKNVDAKSEQGCFWTLSIVCHIGCLHCPSCNGPPKIAYDIEAKPFVECSRCNYGSMMDFIAENLGQNPVMLHSRSLVFPHLLYVAWARLAQKLRPSVAPSTLILAEGSSGDTKSPAVQDGATDTNDIPPPPPCPKGWKAYWSAPAKVYIFMNLETGSSQWDPPTSDAPSDNTASPSQELVSHRPAPSQNAQDPDATLSPANIDQYSLTLDDIPGMVAARSANLQEARVPDAPKRKPDRLPWSGSQLRGPSSSSHQHSQSLNGVPQIVLSPSDRGTQREVAEPDWPKTDFDEMDVPSVEKRKSNFFERWRQRRSER